MAMGSNSDFVPFGSDEYDMVNSELSDTRPARNQRDSYATDYWFGKRYFECIIAQGVFEELNIHDTIEYADSSFEETLKGYPYHQAVEKLKSYSPEAVIQGAGDYLTLMTFLGMTIRVGSQTDRRSILRLIREFQTQTDQNGDEFSSQASRKTVQQSDTLLLEINTPMDDGEEESDDLSIYTTRLKELADQENWPHLPKYEPVRYEKDPRLFITTVMFKGYTIEGKPKRNQRLAKHSASKAAWEFLENMRHGAGTSQASTR